MLGAMTSLTGGGGLSASSSATATTGDQNNDAAFNIGGMTFGGKTGKSNNIQLLILGAFGLAGLFLMTRKK